MWILESRVIRILGDFATGRHRLRVVLTLPKLKLPSSVVTRNKSVCFVMSCDFSSDEQFGKNGLDFWKIYQKSENNYRILEKLS